MTQEFDKKPFCILPFIHLATHPIGTVTPCCITDMENDVSTAKKNGLNMFLNKDSLTDISNSSGFSTIRKKMLNGEFPSECKTCYYNEKNNIYSKRMESNSKFKHLIDGAIENTKSNGELKKNNYKYIELRLGTVCNLKCVTCNPFSSNRWNEDVSVFKNTEFEKSYFKCDIRTEWFRDTKFYDELLTQCDDLEEVWINGGEPTLIKEHGYFLEKLIENGKSKDINLHYSLNMTDVPDRFIEIWKKFKHVRIHLSIDDLDERNDYIRYGSKWNNIMDNFKKIIEYKDVFRIEVCQTVSAYNVFNIDNFKKMCLDYDVIVAHNYVNHPGFQHVSIIPSEMKDEILNNIKYLRDDEKNRLITELTKESNLEDLDKFIKFTYILDNKRGVKITEVLHEWKKYFNYE
jgi:sulfatase maturation enzyme AslB (radical SAM superfamily)